jgi:crotonobetainyl-CoA:carnitine CoA-transferase CaiB-like acyl-CoA transferase
MLQDVTSPRGNTLRIAGTPLKLSRTPAAIRGGPPAVGQHTREVLATLLGLTDAEIDAEYARGAAVEGRDIPPELTES